MDTLLLTVHENGKVRLLARGEKEYYILTPTKQLTSKVQEQLAKAEFCTSDQLEQRGLTFETIKKGQIASLLVDGTSSGDYFTLCLTNKRRRKFLLFFDCPEEEFAAFFEGVPRKNLPRKQNQKSNAGKSWRSGGHDTDVKEGLRALSLLLTAAGVTCVIFFRVTLHPALLILCLLIAAIPLVLEFTAPKFVTLIPSFEKEQEHKRAPVPISRASIVTTGLLFLMTMDDLLQGRKLLLGAVITTALLGVILSFAEEFRREKINYWILLLAVLLSMGPLYFINYSFDFSEPETYVATVTDLEFRSGKNNKDHLCTVSLSEGTTHEVEIGYDTYYALSIGDEVYFHIYPGALGMEYGEVSLFESG